MPAQNSAVLDLRRSGPVTVITGAGMSTASGIPAYRDRQGQWQHTRPVQHRDFLNSAPARRRYWARSFVGWPTMAQAAPNPGHTALAVLERLERVSTVVTQNVDGLHQQAGSRSVIELHGGIRHVRCMSCRQVFPRTQVQEWLARDNPHFDHPAAKNARTAPDGDAQLADAVVADFQVPACPHCAGILKPDVVFFGDSVPRERVAAARTAVDAAATLLVVGSSLMVYSGFRFVELAHRLGKPIVAINQGVTRADPLLTLKVEADCGETLAELVSALTSRRSVQAR